jgi:HEAT repeat protein
MAPPPAVTPMSPEQSAALAEFARACRTAARSVSLYPATHPSIQASLARVITSAGRLVASGDLLMTVHPDTLVIEGRSPEKPDGAVVELAAIMHDRLIGALRIDAGADVHDWHALLLLLTKAPEELIAQGGISRVWAVSGRSHFDIREIDYAEVLRERAGGDGTQWDAIIAYCLQGDSGALDDHGLQTILSMLGDNARFGEFLERLQTAEAGEGPIAARAAALIMLVQRMLDATAQRPKAQGEDVVLQTAADAVAKLTPDMLLGLIKQTQSPDDEQAQVAAAVVNHITDDTIASFVANSVVKARGASERLAQAFEALVPELDRKERLLTAAREEVEETPLGQETNFNELWQSAAQMLTSYSDEPYVSQEYARELSGARRQAIDVERVSDDPPERIRTWLSTIADKAVRDLDLQLLLDLLQVEDDPFAWTEVAHTVSAQIERRMLAGDFAAAQTLASAIARHAGDEGRASLGPAANAVMDKLAAGPLVRNLVVHLRKAEDSDIEPVGPLCRTLGARIVRPLAEALVSEENPRAMRRLRELLVGFGAAGRESVERLKLSPNPAVRRTAIDLLRIFGGEEALIELATMLEDADPQVQREAVRAIVHTGSPEAFSVLQRALARGDAGDGILQELLGMRDDRVVPLLCSVLTRQIPRGPAVETHAQILEALGGFGDHADSARALREVLHRGQWWAPLRTAALRKAAAAALRRIGTPATLGILEEASRTGSRRVRSVARAHVRMTPPRQRQHV